MSEHEFIINGERIMAHDKKTAKIDDIKEIYTDMFSEILVTAQNEVAINSIPMDYINNRVAK